MAKGWLDNYGEQENYNDSKVSAPEGFRGEGYSTKGRNYSPAWGGQFQNGGPVYVESKNDPRYQAYQDSLSLYNNYKNNSDILKNKGITYSKKAGYSKKDMQKDIESIMNSEKLPITHEVIKGSVKKNNKGIQYKREVDNTPIVLNEIAYNKIKPTQYDLYENDYMRKAMSTNDNNKLWDKASSILIPRYKNPQQQVIVQRQSPIEIDNDLNAIDVVGQSQELSGDVSGLRTPYRSPKAWEVQENINMNFGGSQRNYTTSDPSIIDTYDMGPGNTRTVKPVYQMGGYVYPVNYVPQAQMGASIPGAVGFSYARTQSPAPSNGKYAKKTKASAKNGEVIESDRGQWDHPGEITEIGSNDITMEGVPYDVLGVSDTGDTKLMKPGKDYKFKGKKVTEYPMAKNGLRQEQKGLQNLDQLTNFTNYNTKQPGGWLDEY